MLCDPLKLPALSPVNQDDYTQVAIPAKCPAANSEEPPTNYPAVCRRKFEVFGFSAVS
jgi:hypothetical protein